MHACMGAPLRVHLASCPAHPDPCLPACLPVAGVLLLGAAHLDRLWEGAAALDMDLALTRAQLAKLVYDTLDANGMGEDSGGWVAHVLVIWAPPSALCLGLQRRPGTPLKGAASCMCFVSQCAHAACCRHPHPADGVARPEAHTLPEPQHHHWQAHHRDRPRI